MGATPWGKMGVIATVGIKESRLTLKLDGLYHEQVMILRKLTK